MREEVFIKIAKALADPTRHAIVREVRRAGELTCSQVCERFEHTQPTISHHIRTLDAAGILTIRKDGPYHRLTVDGALLDEFARSVSGQAPAQDRTPGKASRGGTRAPGVKRAPRRSRGSLASRKT